MTNDFDLSHLTEDELIELNQMIISELEGRHLRRQKKALRAFEVGERVYFNSPEGNRHEGTILRVNQKTLTIRTDRHGKWRVAPGFVKKLKPIKARAKGKGQPSLGTKAAQPSLSLNKREMHNFF